MDIRSFKRTAIFLSSWLHIKGVFATGQKFVSNNSENKKCPDQVLNFWVCSDYIQIFFSWSDLIYLALGFSLQSFPYFFSFFFSERKSFSTLVGLELTKCPINSVLERTLNNTTAVLTRRVLFSCDFWCNKSANSKIWAIENRTDSKICYQQKIYNFFPIKLIS